MEWLAGRRVRRTSWRLEGTAWAGGVGVLLLVGYPVGAAFVFAFGAIAYVLTHTVWAVALRRRLPPYSRDAQRRADLTNEGVRASGKAWEILIPWGHVLAVEIGTDAIMVAGNEEWADLLIPRRAFPSARDFSEFAESIREHVGAASKTTPI